MTGLNLVRPPPQAMTNLVPGRPLTLCHPLVQFYFRRMLRPSKPTSHSLSLTQGHYPEYPRPTLRIIPPRLWMNLQLHPHQVRFPLRFGEPERMALLPHFPEYQSRPPNHFSPRPCPDAVHHHHYHHHSLPTTLAPHNHQWKQPFLPHGTKQPILRHVTIQLHRHLAPLQHLSHLASTPTAQSLLRRLQHYRTPPHPQQHPNTHSMLPTLHP
mmetsp:Transcript_20472/g.33663  ORF Transcript_20472/g.33663 Transcript_20472/m.33663 type:complete len:212 (-) Transcript_20472:2724-3359(-)